MAEITVYTDGAAKGNPGKGGYGIVLMSGKHRKDISVGYRHTTNNRMELLAVIVALEMIKSPGNKVMIFSDSKYVIDSVVKGWVFNWQKKGFKGKKNADLWLRFLKIYPTQHVQFTWVKGHSGNVLNERVDQLAVKGAESDSLLIDTAYEASEPSGLF